MSQVNYQRGGTAERRPGPKIDMHGPIDRMGRHVQEQARAVQDQETFRRLKVMDELGIGEEATQVIRAKVRANLTNATVGGGAPQPRLTKKVTSGNIR
jgi:hypothetical protein